MKSPRSSEIFIAVVIICFLWQSLPSFANPRQEPSADGVDLAVDSKMSKGVAGEIRIHAPNSRVWNAIHEEREQAPGVVFSRVVSQDDNHLQIEQKFQLIPLIGTKSCVLDMKETPHEKIEFASMLGEVKIAGTWTLEPENDGKETTLKLRICSNSRLAHLMVRPFTKLWISRRLADVKRFAEQEENLNVHGRVLSLL